MTKELFLNAIIKFISGIILIGLLLFLPAGTLQYSKAWLFMGILFLPMFLAGVVLMFKNPLLLRKRLKAKEDQREQSLVVKLSGLMFLAGFILAGLDFRFSWLPVPDIISWTAAAIFLLAYLMYGEVLRENTYLSRTIEIQKNQKVVDTGLYGVVRHPMYSATVLMFLSMPLVLGSLISFAVFLTYPFIIAKRIKHEEDVLTAELQGYAAYKNKVKYKLIPFMW